MQLTRILRISMLTFVVLIGLGTILGKGGGDANTTEPAGPSGTLQFLQTSFDASEGTVVNIRVVRSDGNSGVVSVDYATTDGTAVGGSDYTEANGTLTYPNGVSGNQTISIPVTDDNSAEGSESFTVTLSNVSAAMLGANSSATVNIIDNDEVPSGIQGIESITQVVQLTGAPPSMNDTGQVNVYGTDLGSMFSHSDGRIYFLFGDTFGPPGPPGSADWRSNTMAYTTDFVPSDGITFDGWITDPSGHARALVEGNHDSNDGSGEVTKIPTAGWSHGSRQFMWLMSVKQWGPGVGHWEVNHSEIAYSDDNGDSWTLSGTRWPGSSNFIQVAVTEQTDFLLIWGIPAGRLGGVKLARVPPSDVLDGGAYEYYMGTGWSSNEADGQVIVEAPVGELSVLWNPYLKRWIMMYLNETTASIEVREASEPTGPWSQPWQVVSGHDYPALYAPFMHDQYTENNGETVYFLMSQFGFYNVFLMRVIFE